MVLLGALEFIDKSLIVYLDTLDSIKHIVHKILVALVAFLCGFMTFPIISFCFNFNYWDYFDFCKTFVFFKTKLTREFIFL